MEREDSGYVLINLDRNSPRALIQHVPELYTAKEIGEKQCEQYIYCGIPMYYPVSTMLK